ncbi:MAG TPA: LUD domain-containing protein [Ktedonobacteraceae bacterium]|nr:LUD domain-containing protein [Ktedonobacteraceae bacterium]
MSQNAKKTILSRIRAANASAPDARPTPRDYRERDERERAAIIEDVIDRLLDYKAIVTRADRAVLPQAIADACRQHDIARLVVPADIPADWIPDDVTALRDDPPLAVGDLDTSDGVLTGCALAIAQTGTIILDGGALQGRRALSLVPDRHLCVVFAEQVVGLVPEAIAGLAERATRPITLISGPSATSDIELSRVEGVHGPRTLHVFVV